VQCHWQGAHPGCGPNNYLQRWPGIPESATRKPPGETRRERSQPIVADAAVSGPVFA
jgi:hypothetical protein